MNTEWTTDEEAAALHQRFDDLKKAGGGQAEFARRWGIPGGASMVSQHIKARRPIGIEAAIAYAKGFGCTVSDISPRLGKTLNRANSDQLGVNPPDFKTNNHLAGVSIAPEAINNEATIEQLTAGLADYLLAADPSARQQCGRLLAILADAPQSHASIAAMLKDALMPSQPGQMNDQGEDEKKFNYIKQNKIEPWHPMKDRRIQKRRGE